MVKNCFLLSCDVRRLCRFAYIEFAEKDAVNNALALDESLFRGRQIKVNNKKSFVIHDLYCTVCMISEVLPMSQIRCNTPKTFVAPDLHAYTYNELLHLFVVARLDTQL